jgi:hypothetical protein
MLQRFASTAFVVGTVFIASIPAVGLARDHGGSYGGGRNSSSGRSGGGYSNRGQSFSGGSRYSGGQSFVRPRGYDGQRGYAAGPSYSRRGYIVPRPYERPVYRRYYNGGVYLGYGAPYGYSYDPGYAYGYGYDPGYSYGSAPVPQACTGGSYDQYGAWVPDPNCYSGQPQYQAPPQNYDQNYLNQQPYPQPQQNYNPNQAQRYNQ